MKLSNLGIGPKDRFGRNMPQDSALRQGTAGFFDERFLLRQQVRFRADIQVLRGPGLIADRGQNNAVIGRNLWLAQLLGTERLENRCRLLRISRGVERESVGGNVSRILRI